jgi:site-specific recombinase XerD
LKHYSIRTEQAYTDWIKRFILHFGRQHPRDMGAAEVKRFLTHLAVNGCVGFYAKSIRMRPEVQELPGHSDVSMTMIYTHVLSKGGKGVTSQLDQLV